jgi:hypothetical protein
MIQKLEDLKEWDRNPREIAPKALEGLKASIGEYGDLGGITFNTRLKALVCGHQRVKAMREAYGDAVEISNGVIFLPNGLEFVIRFVDWDEATHTAAAIAANSQYLAGMFTDGLADLLESVQRENPAMFGELNLDELKADLDKLLAKRAGTEYDETAGDGIKVCKCERCGHEHAAQK